MDATYGRAAVNNVSSENAEQLRGTAQYNRLMTQRLYAFARMEAFHDGIADIQYRVMLNPGAGYYLIKSQENGVEPGGRGPGYQIERLDSEAQDFVTLRTGEKFHMELSDRARTWQSVEWVPQVDEFDNYTVNFEVGIEADLSQNENSRCAATWTTISTATR